MEKNIHLHPNRESSLGTTLGFPSHCFIRKFQKQYYQGAKFVHHYNKKYSFLVRISRSGVFTFFILVVKYWFYLPLFRYLWQLRGTIADFFCCVFRRGNFRARRLEMDQKIDFWPSLYPCFDHFGVQKSRFLHFSKLFRSCLGILLGFKRPTFRGIFNTNDWSPNCLLSLGSRGSPT